MEKNYQITKGGKIRSDVVKKLRRVARLSNFFIIIIVFFLLMMFRG